MMQLVAEKRRTRAALHRVTLRFQNSTHDLRRAKAQCTEVRVRANPSGETCIGRHGKSRRSSENGNSSITPDPPSVSASSNGCVTAHPAHSKPSHTAARDERRPAAIAARLPASRIRKNGEWKNPRWPKKLP